MNAALSGDRCLPYCILLQTNASGEKVQAKQSTFDAFFMKKADNYSENKPQWVSQSSYITHIFKKLYIT
jgi:hypothetical protein